jgi:hypothetical protein
VKIAVVVNYFLVLIHSLVDLNRLMYMNDGMNSMANADMVYSRFNIWHRKVLCALLAMPSSFCAHRFLEYAVLMLFLSYEFLKKVYRTMYY